MGLGPFMHTKTAFAPAMAGYRFSIIDRYNAAEMPHAEKFTFNEVATDPRSGTVAFHYESRQAGGSVERCEEVLQFPPEVFAIEPALRARLFNALHLVLGVSYWKRFCAPVITLERQRLSAAEAEFWNTVYTKGLGEFFYNNSIDFRGLVQFPSTPTSPSAQKVDVRPSAIVPFGGGKDSIVVAEMLKREGLPFELVALNPLPLHKEVAEIVGHPLNSVRRIIDPQLTNKTADVYRGHVPMSAIYSYVALIVAIARGHRDIVFAAEHSASQGNVEYLDMEINHQWSKSEEFENLFRNYVANFITPSINYYSKLRDMNELEVTNVFCQHPQYFSHFSSCNRNFAYLAERRLTDTKWCGECPKCAFVFLLLAANISREQVLKIFSRDLFVQDSLIDTYRELLGWKGVKPFECVGTPEEVKEAFDLITARGDFANSKIMQMYLAGRP